MINNLVSTLSENNNPFYRTTITQLHLPYWAAMTFGSLFIIFGAACFLLLIWTTRIIPKYKAEQMEDYHKQVRKSKAKNYDQTGMYVPALIKIRAYWPAIVALVLILVGISFLVGHTITTL